MAQFDWKSIVKSIAPALGTVLGGPMGGLAGAALSKALGTTDAQDATLAAAIQGATPDQLLAIKKADDDFKIQMAELGFKNQSDLEAISAGDRDSARKMRVTTKDWTTDIGFYLITIGFFGLLSYMLKYNIPEANKPILFAMVGSLGSAWTGCCAFFYGASKGDAATKEMLYKSTPSVGDDKQS